MSIMKASLSAPVSLLFFLATACGGEAVPEPVTPKEPVAEQPEAAAEVEEVEEAPAPESGEPAGPTGSLTPKSVISAEETRFVLNFNACDIGIKASETCDRQYSSDPRKRNECMKSARSKIKEDVMEFNEGKSGQLVWTTSTQKASSLMHLRQLNFTWGEETKNSITIVPSKGSPVVIGVPNNYSITIDHPQHGKLVYDAKVSGATR